MRHRLLGAFLALALAPALGGAQDTKDKGTPAEQLQALVEEQTKLQQQMPELLKAAKTNEERQQAFKGYSEKMGAFPARYLELAKKHPKDPAAVDALVRVVQLGRGQGPAKEALEILKKDHLLSEGVGAVGETMIFAGDADSEKFLREVIAKNPHATARGLAAYSLASMLKNQTQRRGSSEEEVAKLSQEAEQLFDRVVAEHAEVKSNRGETLGAIAKRELFELRNLAVGKTVPEIEAEDLDAKKFKLSDYRGKVVFLDFWGHW